jgi:hypothetical protein
MPLARKRIIDPAAPHPWVHCTSRCVRRAFLCGGRFDHRRAWVEERLRSLAALFAVEVAGYAVMSNHLHVIVRMERDISHQWSATEVARRWFAVYPAAYFADGTPKPAPEGLVTAKAKDAVWVSERRKRLADLGWLMKALKEHIAKRANREDDCTGAFWEGRFHSVPLLDQAALIACLAYIDLNPIRAKVADRPETSQFTSGYRRIRARNRHRAAEKIKHREPKRAAALLAKVGLATNAKHAEDGLWLTPLACCQVGEPLANKTFTPDDYLTLLDATGRCLKAGKRGAIPPELAPILARLDLSVDAWLATMLGWRMFAFTSAIGSVASRITEAGKRKLSWIRNRCPLFAEKPTDKIDAA